MPNARWDAASALVALEVSEECVDDEGPPRDPGKTFKYDPKGDSLLGFFVNVHNTVVPHVLRRPEFWMFLALHLAVFACAHYDYLGDLDETHDLFGMQSESLKVITMMTTFFEVFYTGECYARYKQVYAMSQRVYHGLQLVVLELRTVLPDRKYHGHCRLATRYMLASVIMGALEIRSSRGLSDNEWDELKAHRILTDTEVDFLQDVDRQANMKAEKHLVLMQWSSNVFYEAHQKSGAIANTFKDVVSKLMTIFSVQQDLQDLMDLPVPFQYFHLLSMMVVVNLIFWAYFMGSSASVLDTCTFLCADMIFLGMLDLAASLADPFGDDDVDFPVAQWTAEYARSAVSLLEADSSPGAEDWLDHAAAHERAGPNLCL